MTPEVWLAPDIRDLALKKLDDALAKFDAGERNGREGAGEALLILRMIARHALGLTETDRRLAPINALHDGLNRLDDGTAPDLLKPVKRAGRPPILQGEAGVRAMALFTVHMLIELGSDRVRAGERVAEELHHAGFQGGGPNGSVTERTVREWSEAAAADRKGETAKILANLMQRRPIELSDPADAPGRLLARLRDAIEHAVSGAFLQQKPR